MYPLQFEGRKYANFAPQLGDFSQTFKHYNFRIAQSIETRAWNYIHHGIFVQDIVDLAAVAAGNDALLQLLGSQNCQNCDIFPTITGTLHWNFTKFWWLLAIFVTRNSARCSELAPLTQIGSPVNGWESSKVVRLWSHIIWKRGCKSRN